MDGPPLASLSLTHVNYDPTDRIAWLCAHLALVPQALVITYTALIWSTREIEILLMFAGQMGCEALNWVLKRYFKEQRPTQIVGKGYGMPSSHAQFVAFFATYLTLFLLFRHDPHNHPHASSTHTPIPLWQRVGTALAAIGGAAAVALSRTYLKYHSPKQINVGCLVGVACGIAWFVVTSIARRTGLVHKLLELPPLRWARMRDLVVSESLEDAGWERWQQVVKRSTASAKKRR
ncbi:PAP2-domain-containing protein [Zymoseptoria brevis]|uniref:Dolichyldiphosphatase n=1 Tax=Zymoseptoria brevis TaxID=1047168 RepID=A0A0F4GS13_9PEZI|nr:PAP2-domain-containing protein [Zymoseptoria brevis]